MNNWKKKRSMSLGVSNTERSFKFSVQTLLQFCVKNKWDSHSQHSGGCAVGNLSFLHKSQFFSYLSNCGLVLYIYVSVGRRDQQNRQAAITVLKFQYQRRALGGGVVNRWSHWVRHAIFAFSFETIVKATVHYPSSLNARLFYSHNRSGTQKLWQVF